MLSGAKGLGKATFAYHFINFLLSDNTKKEYIIEFKDGKAVSPLKVKGKTNKTGTLINFLPSREVFSDTKFSSSTLQKRMRELAFLNSGLKIKLIDETLSKPKIFENKY